MSPIYFSGFFLDGYKGLSPVFVAFFILFCRCLVRLRLDKKTFYLFFFPLILFSILLVQLQFLVLKYGFLNEFVRHLFPFLFLIVALSYVNSKNRKEIQSLMRGYIDFNILLLLVEMLFRVLPLVGTGCSNFYCFKYGSFLYADSNFTGLHILSIISLLLFNQVKILRYQSIKLIVLLVLLFLAFSRTAYIIFLVLLLIRYYRSMGLVARLFYILLFSFVFIYFLHSALYQQLVSDGSFKTKLYLYERFLIFFNQELLTIIWGYGSGNLLDIIGRESHNIYGLVMEMGVSWLMLMLIFYLYLYISFEKKSFLVLLPLILSGLISLYPLAYLSLHFASFVLFYRFNYLLSHE